MNNIKLFMASNYVKRMALTALAIGIAFSLAGCFPTNRISVNSQGLIALALTPQGNYNLLLKADQEIYLLDLNGRPVRRLTTDGETEAFAQWSPDGQKLLYIRYRSQGAVQTSSLSLYDRSLDQTQQLIETSGTIWEPSFSPDGRKIAYLVAGGSSAEAETRRLQIIDTQTAAVRDSLGGIVLTYRWRPDGKILAFKAREITRLGQTIHSILADLLLFDPHSGQETPLLQLLIPESLIGAYTLASWMAADLSPDGQMLLFMATDNPIALLRPQEERFSIYAAKMQGDRVEDVKRLLEGAGVAVFSPSGRQIAFLQGDSDFKHFSVTILNQDTGQLHSVTKKPGNFLYPFWVSEEQLGFLEDCECKANEDTIWVANLSTGEIVNFSERIKQGFRANP